MVHDLYPLGWRVVYASRSEHRARRYLEMNGLGSRYRVVDGDMWAHSTLRLMLSDEPWQKLGELATESTRWRQHLHDHTIDGLLQVTKRNPHWTSPIHIGGMDPFAQGPLERALRRADRLLGNVGGDEDNQPHDNR